MRCKEITEVLIDDVEDLGDKYQISMNDTKNNYPGQFIIGSMFCETVKKYISLRPPDKFSDRFSIRYWAGKCYRQTIGRHTIGGISEQIATYLQLPNPQRFTGHCFRRTSATLLSDSGANMQMIKQLGRWRSDVIAQGYVENSMHNRQMIFNGVIQKPHKNVDIKPSINTTSTSTSSSSAILTSKPLLSAYQTAIEPQTDLLKEPPTIGKVIIEPQTNFEDNISTTARVTIDTETDDLDVDINWKDFEDDFTVDNSTSIPQGKNYLFNS